MSSIHGAGRSFFSGVIYHDVKAERGIENLAYISLVHRAQSTAEDRGPRQGS